MARASSSRENGLRSSSQLGGESRSASSSSDEKPDIRSTAVAGNRVGTSAASWVPSMPCPSAMSVGTKSPEGQHGVLCARRGGDNAAQRVEKGAYDSTHFRLVFDQQNREPLGHDLACAAFAARDRARRLGLPQQIDAQLDRRTTAVPTR